MLKTIFLALALAAGAAATAFAADAGAAGGDPGGDQGRAPAKGPETGLDLPRYVSLKASKANVRRGPSLSHRVDWEFLRRGMPLQIVAEHGHWRRVRDVDDAAGWVHYSLLSGNRTAIVLAPRAALRDAPRPDARVNAFVEQGVVAELEACEANWCEIDAGGHSGWIVKAGIWGVDPDEAFD